MINSLLLSLIDLNHRTAAQVAPGQPFQRARESSLRYGITLKGNRLLIHGYAQFTGDFSG
jgi:hypothetical protein